MSPVLRTGDRVELCPVERKMLHCGDILVFTASDGREIIHRVVRLDPLQTRGDHCRRNDSPVPSDSPLFLALTFRRNGRTYPLSAGTAGMKEFRRNQFRSKLFSGLRGVLSPIADCNPFRIPFRSLTKTSFPGKTMYYAGKHPVGWMDEKGWHWMRFARYFVEMPPEDHHA